ncbi:MAG: hypothetical protein RLT05_29660, partial [Bauldia litoralis]
MRYAPDADPVITLTSGPVNAYPDVLRALGRTVLYDYDPAFQLHYEQVIGKMQTAMRTSNRPVILHGEPVLGLEAAAASPSASCRSPARNGAGRPGRSRKEPCAPAPAG